MKKKTIIGITLGTSLLTALALGAIPLNKTYTVHAADEHDHTGWVGVSELPTEAGNYDIYLTSDITLTDTWTIPSGETNLCLNGHVITVDGEGFNAIYLGTDSILNLYDCGSTVHYFTLGDNGLWELASDQSIPTEYSVTGGCITGASTTGNGGAVYCSLGAGAFNMYGGNIVGNSANNGAGVYNLAVFNMYGGSIVGNYSTSNGGAVLNTPTSVNVLTGGVITKNTSLSGSGVAYKEEMCFTEGTPITMADGTTKPIEELQRGDAVRVFDHNEGRVTSAKLFDAWSYPEKHSDVVDLHFTNNIDLTIVYGHSFFEREANKYVPVTKDNVKHYVGHEFYNANNDCWETLTGFDFVDGEVDTYVITSEYHLNCIANGMLSNEDGFYTTLTNIFDFDETLKVDAIKKANDIEKYGIYEYENLNYVSEYVYDVLNLEYINVAFGKGLISEGQFNYLEAYYAAVDPELYCNTSRTTKCKSRVLSTNAKLEPFYAATLPTGVYVGGSIQIFENANDNLFLSSGKTLTIGTGMEDGGNGVACPTEDMLIGITLADGYGAFTATGTMDYSANFFSDNQNYCINYNIESENYEYLELVEIGALDVWANAYLHLDQTENNGYCKDDTHQWYKIAKTNLMTLGDEIITELQTSTDTKIASYRARYEAWARANGDYEHCYEDDFTYIGSNIAKTVAINNSATLIALISLASVSVIGGYFLLRRKSKHSK